MADLFQRHRSRIALSFIYLLVFLYITTFAALSLRRHDAFLSGAFDLGIYDQAIWNSLHGEILRSTNEEGFDILLADHVEPILLLISPLYLIYSSPRTLLLLQTVVISLGALPLFGLARRRVGGNLIPLLLSAAYLLFPALESSNTFDFHPVALVPTLILTAFYFLEVGNRGLFLAFAILAMACKEDISLSLFLVGLYLIFIRRERRVGLLLTLLAGLWFYIAWFIILGHFSPHGVSIYYAERYSYLGRNLPEMVKTAITHPQIVVQSLFTRDKLCYLRGLLAPLGFTSLLSPEVLLLSSPSLAINLLSQSWLMHREGIFLHYSSTIVPFLILSSVYGLERAGRWLKSRWPEMATGLLCGLVLLSSLIYHRYYGLSPLAEGFIWPPVGEHQKAAEEMAGLIPPEATVSASPYLNPHVSQRETIYVFPNIHEAQYIFIDTLPTDIPLITRDFYDLVWGLIEEGEYGIRASKDGLLLLERGLSEKCLSPDFYTFALGDAEEIEHPMVVDLGGSLELVGFSVVAERTAWLHIYVDLFWRLRDPIGRDLRIFTFLTDPEGEIVPGTDLEVAAPIWYPTSQWPAGRVIKSQTFHWTIERGGEFGVAIGVIDGENQWDLESRLPPQVKESSFPLKILHGNTLLGLGTIWNNGGMVRLLAP